MKINFVGDFKQLKPIGYKFLRLYAANYICYRKEEVWIWKKGKEVEIADLYSNSYLILKHLIENDFKIGDKFNTFILNIETKQIEKYDSFKHEPYHLTLSDEEMRKFYDTYRKSRLSETTIAVLKELYDMKLINIDN